MKALITIIVYFFFSLTAWSLCEKRNVSFHMTDPVERTPWEIQAESFRPQISHRKFPVVFILPPISGENAIDQIFALNFCLHGMGAYILNVVKDYPLQVQIENLDYENERLIRAQAGVSNVIDTLLKDQYVSGDFGILGSSQGAIFAAYTAGVDSRIKSSVMIVGGGNLPGILAYGKEDQVEELRNGRMEFFRIPTQKDYEIFLQKNIKNDPLNVAANIAPRSSYLFIANRDKTVPTRYQHQLKKSIPQPLVYVMNGGHTEGVIKTGTIHKHKITTFFLNRLFVEDVEMNPSLGASFVP